MASLSEIPSNNIPLLGGEVAIMDTMGLTNFSLHYPIKSHDVRSESDPVHSYYN